MKFFFASKISLKIIFNSLIRLCKIIAFYLFYSILFILSFGTVYALSIWYLKNRCLYCNLINEIQFIGRFRNGVESYYLAIGTPKENENLLSFETIKNEIIGMATEDLNYLNNRYKKYKHIYSINDNRAEMKREYPFISFDEIIDEYYIDEILLNDFIFRNYIKQFLNYPKNLLNKFKEHKTFIANKYLTSTFKENDIEISKISKDIKNKKQTLKKEEKQHLKESLKHLNYLDDKELHRMLNNLWDKEFIPVETLEHFEVWNEFGEEKINLMQELIRYIPNLDKVQAFRLVTTHTKKDIDFIIDCFNAIRLNKIYDIDPNDLIRKKKTSLEMKLKTTRDFMRLNDYEKNNKRITDKLLNELLEYCIESAIISKEKKLTKVTIKTLINLIKIIYKCIDDKTLKISSVRKNIDDLINTANIN